MEAQIKIHNSTLANGRRNLSILSVQAEYLPKYLNNILEESKTKFNRERPNEFKSHPLLELIDSFDTNESFIYNNFQELPRETVLNSKNNPVLIILPPSSHRQEAINVLNTAKTPNADNIVKDERKEIL